MQIIESSNSQSPVLRINHSGRSRHALCFSSGKVLNSIFNQILCALSCIRKLIMVLLSPGAQFLVLIFSFPSVFRFRVCSASPGSIERI